MARPSRGQKWLVFLPAALIWLFVIAIPLGVGFALYHYSTWPKAFAWFVGIILFAVCLFFGEWLLRGMTILFSLREKKKR